MPVGNPGEWVRPKDIPAYAFRLRPAPIVFRLMVGKNGRATDCIILEGSGSAELDAASCDALRRRARFHPSTDEQGKRSTGTYTSRITLVAPLL